MSREPVASEYQASFFHATVSLELAEWEATAGNCIESSASVHAKQRAVTTKTYVFGKDRDDKAPGPQALPLSLPCTLNVNEIVRRPVLLEVW